MDPDRQTILVTGGTGHQGGAAARHLLADGWNVRALVRDLEKPEARALAQAGAELVLGDLTNEGSVQAAVAGAYGVYSVQALTSFELETAESKMLADAALAANVKHFVYSSVIGADRESALPWVVGKVANEHYLRSLGMPLTIWRPATFMESLLNQRDGIRSGKLTGFDPPNRRHQWIAVDDIGRFVALAFRKPDAWIGQATEIAGDELTGDQCAAVLSLALGVRVGYEQLMPPAGGPAPASPHDEDDRPPNRANVDELRESIPGLLTVDAWVTQQRALGTL